MKVKVVESICVHILRKCNLACPHCWSQSNPQADEILDLYKVTQFISELKKYGLIRISISGGEPTLHPDFIYFVNELLSMDFFVTITTNGVGRPNIVELLKYGQVTPTGKLSIRVSIDGPEPVHDLIRGYSTFHSAIETLIEIKKWLQWVGVNTVVTPGISSSIIQLVDLLKMHSIDNWAFITQVLPFRSDEENKYLLQEFYKIPSLVKKYGYIGEILCWDYLSFPNTYLSLDSNYRLTIPGNGHFEDVVFGNIHDLPVPDLINEIERVSKDVLHEHFTLNNNVNYRNPFETIIRF